MKKKKLLAAIAAGLLLGGVSFPTAQAESVEGQAAVEVQEPTEGAPLESLAVDPALRSLGVYKIVRRYEEQEGGVSLLSQSWAEVLPLDAQIVSGRRSMVRVDSYPALANALRAFNDGELRDALATRKKFVDEAKTEARERAKSGAPFHGYYAKKDFIPRRADSFAVSLLASDTTYTGGAHGMTVLRGVNIRTADGTRIPLSEVCPDSEMLVRAIIDRLREDYPPATFFDSMEDTVTTQVAEEKIAWTLDARGVTFYFNPYDIAPYASGILTATVLFDEKPGLFEPRYMGGPASYCEYLRMYETNTISLRDDPSGRHDRLQITDLDGGAVRIVLNDMPLDDLNADAKDIVPIHVHTGAGRNFLYLDCRDVDAPDRSLRIYNLDSPAPILINVVEDTMLRNVEERGKGYTLQWLMTDPYEFRVDVPFRLREDGTPWADNVEISTEGVPAFG